MQLPGTSLMLLILLLWVVLVTVLFHAAYRALKEKKKRESTILCLATIGVIAFSAEWIVLMVWGLLCQIGLPLGCIQ